MARIFVDTLIVMLYYCLFQTYEMNGRPYSLFIYLKPKLDFKFTFHCLLLILSYTLKTSCPVLLFVRG